MAIILKQTGKHSEQKQNFQKWAYITCRIPKGERSHKQKSSSNKGYTGKSSKSEIREWRKIVKV